MMVSLSHQLDMIAMKRRVRGRNCFREVLVGEKDTMHFAEDGL